MAIVVTHTKVSTIPDGDDTSLIRPSDWNQTHTLTGLGTMAEQNANAVAITGGTMSGVTVTGYIPTTEKGAALGVATLDAGGQVPVSQLPAMGDLNYQGTWNASTNTPTLTSSVGTKGYYYVVSVAGSTNLNGITDWQVGDWAVYNGSVWQKIDNTDAVTSVNGFTGTVVLTTTDVAEGTNQYFTTARARTSVSAGTGISYDSGTGVITNSSPSLGGDVVGPSSATDNAIARYDTTTGKLLQNSVVTIGDTGATTGITTLSASTSVTTPIVQANNSAGLALKNSAGTTQISMGAGGGDNASINVSTNINGVNAQIDISPTGTGHVHIKPTGVNSVEIAPTFIGEMDNITIGATTAAAGSFTNLSVTGTTSFDGSQGTVGQVLTSAGTGATPTWTTPTNGTVTSVTGTAPVVSSGGNTPAISMPAATTSVDGYLTSTNWNTFNNKASLSSNTFTGNQIIEVTDNTNAALRITQLGTGNAILVEDSTNPDSSPFVVDNSGRVGIGANPSAGQGLLVANLITGGTTAQCVRVSSSVQSDVTSDARGFISVVGTQASAFTLANLRHFLASQGSFGATSAVTTQVGFNAASTLTGATNNYGFLGEIASGTGRYNFYASGTADNYFAGNVGIGKTPTTKLDVNGTITATAYAGISGGTF